MASDSYTRGDELQARTRQWLESTLQEKLPANQQLSQILKDGELLLRLSKLFMDWMSKLTGGKPRVVTNVKKEADSGTKGKWAVAYNNVDIFLQVCRDMGLTDMDLCSLPDVVEERNIKRACLCIRALALRAKGVHFPVKEFEESAGVSRIRAGGLVENARRGLLSKAANGADWRTPNRPSGPKSKSAPSKDKEVAKKGPPWLLFFAGVLLSAVAAGAAAVLLQNKKPSKLRQSYEIKEGDTLSEISRKLGKNTWQELVHQNPDISNPDLIFPSSRILL
eukprot:TRINITY_DN2733_c0_g1_i3.p1 TRINITY_DN2733_c0_g1~~TRINITY_DN2733_c0_g1_i3.p1  ORF type:complete len:279 (+),score=72.58 TRINITY_DN2733_c0_g1_i3:240-1076(+)